MSALMLLYRDSAGAVMLVPFAYRDGNLPELVETMLDYIYANGLASEFVQGVADERLRVILEQRAEIMGLKGRVRELLALLGQTPVRELVGGAA